MSDKSIIQSVEKVPVILNLFTKKEPMLTLHDIHQRTGYSKTTAMRFCNTLTNIGFLEKVFIGQVPYYRLGIELFTIGSLVIHSIDLIDRAKKYLKDISNQLEDNSYLFIERNNKAICIDAVKGSYYIQDATTNIGDVLPFNQGGGPLAILAYLESNRQSEIIKSFNMNQEEQRQLYERLDNIRNKGYSFSNNETNVNTAAIGVPVFNHEGKVAGALSVGGIEIRFSEERLPRIVEVTKNAAVRLSNEIGWNLNQ
jgi:IclR family transcriptional regulator, KDG regulon repressor